MHLESENTQIEIIQVINVPKEVSKDVQPLFPSPYDWVEASNVKYSKASQG